MAKKESAKRNYHDTSEKEVRKEYLHTLGEVYREKGIMAGISYELKSIGYSLGKIFGNVPDHIVSANEGSVHSTGRDNVLYGDAQDRIEKRKAERKAFVLRDSKTGLEATLSILGLVGGAFFLSSNMTGNVIGLSSSSSNIIGSVLLVIGLVACFSWVKSKKTKVVKKK